MIVKINLSIFEVFLCAYSNMGGAILILNPDWLNKIPDWLNNMKKTLIKKISSFRLKKLSSQIGK